MDENKAIGRKRHQPTDDEKAFYIKTASKMGDVRYKAGISQNRMAEACGYSAQQIRSFENGQSEDGVVAIPAYVLAKYAEVCDTTVDEIISNWKAGRKMTARARHKEEKAREEEIRETVRMKRLKPEELFLVNRLRTELGDVGVVPAAQFLSVVRKDELDLIYCINMIELMGEKYDNIIKCIRSQIYALYEAIVPDPLDNITPNLSRTRESIIPDEEREVPFEEGDATEKKWNDWDD